MLQILLYLFFGTAAIQFIYYLFIFRAFAFLKQKKKETKHIPVSVLICAKNEENKLNNTLQSVLTQNYPTFQMVLINDRSIDQTLEIMEKFQENNPKMDIKIVNIKDNEQFWGNKKYALTLGIKAATHEYLLFTDADCKPNSNQWIQKMVNHFTANKSIILGYGAYNKVKNSVLNKIIRFETLITAMHYFSFAKIGMPYMGVGRNIAYTKTQFFKKNGFANHLEIRSGDDDLFVNENATKRNTALCFVNESFTYSIPKKTFKGWIQQKRRHISTAKHYKPIHQFLLGLQYITQVLFWILASILITFLFSWKIVLGIVIIRLFLQYLIIGFSAKKLNEKDLILYIPFLELFLISLQMIIFIKNKIAAPKHW